MFAHLEAARHAAEVEDEDVVPGRAKAPGAGPRLGAGPQLREGEPRPNLADGPGERGARVPVEADEGVDVEELLLRVVHAHDALVVVGHRRGEAVVVEERRAAVPPRVHVGREVRHVVLHGPRLDVAQPFLEDDADLFVACS